MYDDILRDSDTTSNKNEAESYERSGEANVHTRAFMADGDDSASSSDESPGEEERFDYPHHAVVDSGASTFITRHPSDHFKVFKSRKSQIEIAKQGSHLSSVGEGTLPIVVQGEGGVRINLDLEDTLYTPGISKNLFSVSAACDMGLSAIFTSTHVLFCRSDDYTKTVFTARREGSLWLLDYALKNEGPPIHALTTNTGINELVVRLHEQHAHAPIRQLKEMAISGELDHVPKATREALCKVSEIHCVACAAGTKRIKKMRRRKGRDRGKYEPFELMVCDHAGPYPSQWGGFRFISVWVCACTGFTFTFRTHNLTAASVVDSAEVVLNHVNTQTTHRWRRLRSDRGSDWTSNMLGKWMKEKGLVHQLVSPDAHGHIGIAENKIKTLNDRMRVVMVSSGAPPNLCFHAIEMVNGFFNRTTRKDMPSPLESVGGESHLSSYPKADFGQLTVTVELEKARKDRPSRHISCVYLGPDWSSYDGSVLLRIDNGRIIHRRTVKIFHERPFLTRGTHRPPPQTPLLMALEEFDRDRRVRENDRLDRLAGEDGEVRRHSTASGDDSSVSDDRYGGREVSHVHSDGSDSESSKSDIRYDGHERGSVDDSKSDGHLPSDDEDYLKEEDKEKGEGITNEFQRFDQFEEHGRNDHDTSHFTRSRKPVLSSAAAFAAMEKMTEELHPKDFITAQKFQRRTEYVEATKRELLAHLKNGSFEIISEDQVPQGTNVINTRFVYCDKINGVTQESTIKARLVARGYEQEYGDYTDTYAPTVDAQCIRACIAFAAYRKWVMSQMDVDSAFLIPPLLEHEIVYAYPPKGFELMCELFEFLRMLLPKTSYRVVLRFLKCVYGLKNASNKWNGHLAGTLKRLGFKQEAAVDSCLYLKRKNDGILQSLLIYHVDDILLCGEDDEASSSVEQQVSKVLPMKLMGRPKRFVGIEFHYCDNGDVVLHQEHYLNKLLIRFGMEECSSAPSPAVGKRLEREGPDVENGIPFREAIGGLLWASIMTRPDLLHAVTQVAQYTSCFKMNHWQAIKRILRYVSGTRRRGILFKQGDGSLTTSVITHTDADHAGDPDRRSYMGNISFVWGGPIAWASKKIRGVCISAHESELVAMSRAAMAMKWQVRLVTALEGKPPENVHLFADNQGARVTAVNGIRSRRSKHIEIADLYVLQAVEDDFLEVKRVDSADNLADFLTKPLGPQKFAPIIRMLQMDRITQADEGKWVLTKRPVEKGK